jgi:protein arginine kinase activator
MEQQFGLSDLLAGLAEFEKPQLKKETISVKCENCGFSYADFKKIGRLGCSDCYDTFRKYLGPLLKKIHGSGIHAGKSPVKVARVTRKKADLTGLRTELQKAIEAEAFEEAAKIRDQIKELEKKELQDDSEIKE